MDCIVNYASNVAAAEEVKGQIAQLGGRAVIVQADVSLSGDRQRLVDEAYAAFGRVDLLVNNAGSRPPSARICWRRARRVSIG